MKLIILDCDGVVYPIPMVGQEWEPQPIARSMDAIAFLTQSNYTVVILAKEPNRLLLWNTMKALNEIQTNMHIQVQKSGGYIDGIWLYPFSETVFGECYEKYQDIIVDILNRWNVSPEKAWLVSAYPQHLQASSGLGLNLVGITGDNEPDLLDIEINSVLSVDSLATWTNHYLMPKKKASKGE